MDILCSENNDGGLIGLEWKIRADKLNIDHQT